MIRVLHVSGTLNVGGAESRLLELLRHLDPKRFEFSFATFDAAGGALADEVRSLGGRLVHLPHSPLPPVFERRLHAAIRAGRFEVVHSHIHYASGLVMRAARRAGVPTRVVHVRTTSDLARQTPLRPLYRSWMRSLMSKHATEIIGVCEAALQGLFGNNWSDDERCRVLYNGFHVTRAEASHRKACRDEVRNELGLAPNSPVAITVARLEPVKNHPFLLQVARAVASRRPDFRWLFVGGGAERTKLERAAQALGVAQNVRFLGQRRDVPRLLACADAFVLGSLHEGLPGAVVEGLFAGLPAVSTDLPGVREIAALCGGVEVAPFDVEAFARRVIECMTGRAGSPLDEAALYESFGFEAYLRTIEALYAKRAGGQRDAA